jgi:hypothetical protein
VRALYDRMVRIRITPDWAKLIDFEATIPQAVEDLARTKMQEEASRPRASGLRDGGLGDGGLGDDPRQQGRTRTLRT